MQSVRVPRTAFESKSRNNGVSFAFSASTGFGDAVSEPVSGDWLPRFFANLIFWSVTHFSFSSNHVFQVGIHFFG